MENSSNWQDYEPILSINHKNEISEKADLNKDGLLSHLDASVTDKVSLRLLQVSDLHQAIDNTKSAIGSACLYRSLIQPPTSLEIILSKQDGLQEIESNDKLNQFLQEYIRLFSIREKFFFKFMNGQLSNMSPYHGFKKAIKVGKDMPKLLKDIPNVESSYLRQLTLNILNLENEPVYAFFHSPIFRGRKRTVKSVDEISFLSPMVRMKASTVSFSTIFPVIPIGLITFGSYVGFLDKSLISQELLFRAALFGPNISMLYGLMMKPSIDLDTGMNPLRDRLSQDNSFNLAVESIARIDEMLSHTELRKSTTHDMTLPIITDAPYHSFVAQNLRNPVQAVENENYVANEVNLNGSRLTFITGPNSGGKTTYCKSIVQNQLMAQIGGYVFASKAKVNIADKIAYQAPMFDSLQDDEGRFGTEMKRTSEIFYSTNQRSLIILDELAEGTTIEEKMQQSYEILDDFHTIGGNTLLVTHNHALVEQFKADGKGQYLQVEFNGDLPTHKIMGGISKESHANRVAEKIGFSKKDRMNYLIQQGYLND